MRAGQGPVWASGAQPGLGAGGVRKGKVAAVAEEHEYRYLLRILVTKCI